MRNLKLRILLITLLTTFGVFIAPRDALAVIQNLNSATGMSQTFQSDSNITISTNPLTNIHSLGWFGQLPVSRGGTGANSFSAGSLLFSNGTSFSQDNSNLFWNDTNNRLGIGTTSPASALDVSGNAKVSGNLDVTGNITTTNLVPYTGATGDVDLGVNEIAAGGVVADNFVMSGQFNIDNFGVLVFTNPQGGNNLGVLRVGSAGKYFFDNGSASAEGVLNFSGLSTPTKQFTFPNITGTLSLLEANQTWSGLNKFEGGTNSTIYVGSSVKSGCIALGDSDGSGVTYVTANDGVLSASTTKPSFCQ